MTLLTLFSISSFGLGALESISKTALSLELTFALVQLLLGMSVSTGR